MLKKSQQSENSGDEPEQHINEIDPHSILHAEDLAVTLGVLLYVHLAEDAKERYPKYTIEKLAKARNKK